MRHVENMMGWLWSVAHWPCPTCFNMKDMAKAMQHDQTLGDMGIVFIEHYNISREEVTYVITCTKHHKTGMKMGTTQFIKVMRKLPPTETENGKEGKK